MICQIKMKKRKKPKTQRSGVKERDDGSINRGMDEGRRGGKRDECWAGWLRD